MNVRANEKRLVTPEMLQPLPEPVQRYLAFTGVVGKPWIHDVRLRQAGRFRMGPGRPWLPITAEQTYTIDRPGFLWKAVAWVARLPLLKARDRYQDGHGHMFGKLAGLFTIFDARGPEMDQASLARYLSEMVWFPTAFLAGNIQWQGLDEHSAQVTLTDGGKSVSGRLTFGEDGRPTDFTTQRYYSHDDNRYSLETWSNPITKFQVWGGMNLPVQGQVIWKLAGGDFPYFKWEVTQVEYNCV